MRLQRRHTLGTLSSSCLACLLLLRPHVCHQQSQCVLTTSALCLRQWGSRAGRITSEFHLCCKNSDEPMQRRRRQVVPAPHTFGVYGSTLVRFPVTQAKRLCLLQGLREDRRHVRRFTQEIEDALQCLGRVVYKVFIL